MSKFLGLSRLVNGRLRGLFVAQALGLGLLFGCAGQMSAQITSSIDGIVRDPSGALVPGATIVAINEASKAKWTIKSNGEGAFHFAALPAATYTVRVSGPGFETYTVTGVTLHPGDSVNVPNIRLKPGAEDVSVTVTAESAGVMLDSPEHSALITSQDINRLSTVGRDVNELISILPGFTLNAGTDLQNEGAGGIYGYQSVGFGSGQVGSWGANGAAPQQGLVNIKADGANVIDPGDMGGQISNVNMDQVEEVKVQTANFGADQSKGPIVVNAVGKSGGSQFHGGLYTYFRNTALNSNDWLGKYLGTTRPQFQFFYPGGNIGGPVLIPHTHFNAKKRLVFWTGFEYYGQKQPAGLATAFVPTPAMLSGDLSAATLAKALNVDAAALATNCAHDWSTAATYANIGGVCTPAQGTDSMGNAIINGQLQYIDPATTTISKLWPAINRTPQPVFTGGTMQYASDGINYVKNVMATHNGFQLHTRIDESFTDNVKFSAVYNFERVNDVQPLNNIYYNPGGTVPYPTPMNGNERAHYLTLSLIRTVGSSFTNELTASGVYFNEPAQFANPALAQTTGTAWGAAGYSHGHLNLNETQLPRVIAYDWGLPSLSFGYVPPTSQFLRKFDWTVADNVNKVWKTHSLKFGYYMEEQANNGVTLGSAVNGTLTFMRWDSCYVNQTAQTPNPPPPANAQNVVGNFLMGCPLGYSQDNSDPILNQRYMSFEAYGNDEWKVTPKLTLTLGIRFSHMQPWHDPHGIGFAVWDPTGVAQYTLNPTGLVTTANTTWPGIHWHAKDPRYPNSGFGTKALFYAPRVGLAYDLYGNGSTVFRGGWGMYYSHDSVGAVGGAQTTAIGMQTYTNPSSITCTFGQLFTNKYVGCGAYSSTLQSSITPFNVSAVDPKDSDMPLTYNYNFTLDQRGPWKSAFEIAYVGSHGVHLPTLGNLQNQNIVPLGAFFGPDPLTGQINPPGSIPNTADYRPYPNYQAINVERHLIWSNYNSLQVSWNRQKGDFVYGANYTWSKALGVRGNWDTGAVGDPVNPSHDYGVVSFDRPQALNLSYSYQEGKKFRGNRVLGQVLNGWELSGVTSIQSGPDLAVSNGNTNFGLSGGVAYNAGASTVSIPISGAQWLGSSDYTLQPIVTCNPSANLKTHQYVNGSCFGLPPMGTQGWWNLPDVHGPAYFKSDLSVYKDFLLTEHQNLQFRLSGFNFLNHPLVSFYSQNLGVLNLNVGSSCSSCTYKTPSQALQSVTITNASTFGSTEYRNGVRIVELGMKYNF